MLRGLRFAMPNECSDGPVSQPAPAPRAVDAQPASDPGATGEQRVVYALCVDSRTQLPASCAACVAPAREAIRIQRLLDRQTFLIPYCPPCHRAVQRQRLRTFSVIIASLLLGISLALLLPLAWPTAGFGWHALCATLGSVAAWPALWLARGQMQQRGAAVRLLAGSAAWFGSHGRLVCANRAWASRVAELNGAPAPSPRRARRWAPPQWLLAPLLTLACVPLVEHLYRARVRIVNATLDVLNVELAGLNPIAVRPTSAESPTAGLWVDWPTGLHRVVVRDPSGQRLEEHRVLVRPGMIHLFAPASPQQCFWLEQHTYGRQGPTEPSITPLDGPDRFWALTEIDAWFAPAPPASADVRSSGGHIVALRQGPCERMPPPAGSPPLLRRSVGTSE